MFKKNIKEVNLYDSKMNEKFRELNMYTEKLRQITIKTYIKNIALSIYLKDTPDYEKAKKDYEDSQHSVYCAIGAYDTMRAEIINYRKTHIEKFGVNWSIPVDSHIIIEDALEYRLK